MKKYTLLVILIFLLKTAMGQILNYSYDSLGRLTQVIYPDSSIIKYSYDPSGNRKKRVIQQSTKLAIQYITFSGKVYLQSAYSTTTGIMNNTLNTLGILQANASIQPYAGIYGYTGTENVSSTFFASNTGIVDWVLIELRDPAIPSTIIATRAAFVKQDGTLVETDGTTNQISFQNVPAGNYFVAIRHRNHLGIRSSSPVDFSTGSGTYDFTTSAGQCYQNQSYTSTVQIGSIWAMRGGNANSNSNVKYNRPGNDQNQILNIKLSGSLSNILNNVYVPEDVNMNGNVKWNGPGNDQNFLLNTLLLGSLSTIYNEQL